LPSRLRVPLGYAVGLLVLLLSRPSPVSVLLGLPLGVIGEGIRVWASGHIDKTRSLATGGPYAFTRNPLYLGSLLLALGVAVASASLWVVLAVAAYFTAFYPSVMREEAGFLREKFAVEYRGWAAEVPSFLPRLTPGGPRASRFTWERVGRNREWRTAFGLLLAAALLYLRHLLAACGVL
jgi:protein-S-isoprenylcysteine O-methyltransferase Ste14